MNGDYCVWLKWEKIATSTVLSHRLQIIEFREGKKNNLFSLFLLRDFQNGQLIFPHTGGFVLIIQYTCITVYQMNMG